MNLFNILLTEAGETTTGGSYTWIIMIVMIVLLGGWMFFSWRSNKKKQQEQANLLNGIELGDEVTTIGGIVGEIVSIKEETIVIETSKAGTRIRFLKSAVRSVDVSAAVKRGDVAPNAPTEKSAGKIEQAEIVEDKKPEAANEEKTEK